MLSNRILCKLPAKAVAAQVRNLNVLSAPPKNRVGVATKLIHGAVISGAILAGPVWVAVHFSEYRTGK